MIEEGWRSEAGWKLACDNIAAAIKLLGEFRDNTTRRFGRRRLNDRILAIQLAREIERHISMAVYNDPNDLRQYPRNPYRVDFSESERLSLAGYCHKPKGSLERRLVEYRKRLTRLLDEYNREVDYARDEQKAGCRLIAELETGAADARRRTHRCAPKSRQFV